MSAWRVWTAFQSDRDRGGPALWRALAEACRGPNGKIDANELDRWIDVLVWHRWADA